MFRRWIVARSIRQLCKRVLARKYNFLLIDASHESHLGKCSQNLNDFWVPPTHYIEDDNMKKSIAAAGGEKDGGECGLLFQPIITQLRG